MDNTNFYSPLKDSFSQDTEFGAELRISGFLRYLNEHGFDLQGTYYRFAACFKRIIMLGTLHKPGGLPKSFLYISMSGATSKNKHAHGSPFRKPREQDIMNKVKRVLIKWCVTTESRI